MKQVALVSQARVQGSDIPTPAAMKAGKTRGDPITPRWARDGVPTPSDCTPPVVGVVGYLEGRRLGHGCPSFGGVVPRARPSVVRTWRAAERSLTVTPGMVGLNDGFAHRATLAGHTVRADPPGGGGGCRLSQSHGGRTPTPAACADLCQQLHLGACAPPPRSLPYTCA